MVLCSCGAAAASNGRTTSPVPSNARTASVARLESPLPSASPLPSLSPVARASFPNCRLAYLKGSEGDAHLTGGFVQGSVGVWTADPSGGISKSGDFLVTDAPPTLKGSDFSSDDSGAYDHALRRWLPVKRAQVRSDGLAYAYAEP